MARFWPKWCYNGRVMAREVSFYKCLWVTKLCAKFGCSRTPWTASAHKSSIVLRCMWKEPAPLVENMKKFGGEGEEMSEFLIGPFCHGWCWILPPGYTMNIARRRRKVEKANLTFYTTLRHFARVAILVMLNTAPLARQWPLWSLVVQVPSSPAVQWTRGALT